MGYTHHTHYTELADNLAVELLGLYLVRKTSSGVRIAGRIIETEAYLGPEDQASHARNGHRSPRNESMYAAPGRAYVYFTYGMHHCMNISCAREGVPHAVLIRAIEPSEGIDAMRALRDKGQKKPLRDRDLCSGPARLCQAMAIDRSLDGHDLTKGQVLWVEPPADGIRVRPHEEIVNTPRIGLGKGCGDWLETPLRWFLRGQVSP